jgi:GNAT superfamily N-acetyltransferase
MTIQVRAVTEADVPQVVSLVEAVLTEFGIAFGTGSDTDGALLHLPGSYTAEGGAFLVAEEAGVLVGTGGIAPTGGGDWELRKMFLRPEARGRRVGQALYDACLAHARAQGARRVVLDTTERMKSAIRFYERNGFVRDDTQRRASRCNRGYRLDLP